jgi:hypothetical protein
MAFRFRRSGCATHLGIAVAVLHEDLHLTRGRRHTVDCVSQ